jgi:predicted transcriptional regulator
MSNTLTVRLPGDLAEWLDDTSRKSGLSRSLIARRELERARQTSAKPWAHLVGALKNGPSDLSMRRGFSRK